MRSTFTRFLLIIILDRVKRENSAKLKDACWAISSTVAATVQVVRIATYSEPFSSFDMFVNIVQIASQHETIQNGTKESVHRRFDENMQFQRRAK